MRRPKIPSTLLRANARTYGQLAFQGLLRQRRLTPAPHLSRPLHTAHFTVLCLCVLVSTLSRVDVVIAWPPCQFESMGAICCTDAGGDDKNHVELLPAAKASETNNVEVLPVLEGTETDVEEFPEVAANVDLGLPSEWGDG